MSFLRFAEDEVKDMASKLETSGSHMKSASKAMKDAGTKEIGHKGLESACDDFANSWDYGFGQLSKLTKGVSKFADKAAAEFAKLDQKLYGELQKSREGEGEK
ncbi:hypothetical protein ACIO5Z_28045 [Streptomyces rochei]|uniref:hypothetical protein n=1 Tax=Streptomyces TaxID=1883 RepID=UPI001587F77D|nr:hypothetical protein [Streptomyces sp. KAI 90]MBD2817473.1 hypothetical protein [Streptomyces parvulus]NUV94481.1 hypothetical protein [Streptomyces sp. KAI 90]